MKNKRQFFSLSLYVDALKQLRVMGIIMLVFVGFVSTSMAILEDESFASYNVFALSFLSFVIFSPVMTLYIFRFLTSRKSSDVFHSMPYTRVCLFFSYVFAVVTYVIAILSVNFATLFIVEGSFGTINLTMVISVIVCNLLVISAVTLAQGMTGTIFTNISVTGVILFFPRLLIYFVASFVCEFCPYINIEYIKFPFGTSSNILAGMFISGYSLRVDKDIKGIIYTFVLSLIYFCVAAILFNRKKSETAGTSATNRLVQHIIRSVITLVICLLPLSDILYKCADNEEYMYGDFELGLVIIYFFAIFIYFLYELLSTKKLKNLVKIIPGIIFVAILNVAIVASVFGISNHIKKFQPKAEGVEYIIMHNDNERYYCRLTDELYFGQILDGVKITDERIIKLICDQFENVRNSHSNNHEYGGYNFSFYVDGKVYDRYFSLNETRFKMMLKYLFEDEKISNEYRTLPEYNELKSIEIMIEGKQYLGDDIEEIYEKYKEDLMNLSKDNIIKYFNNESYIDRGYIELELDNDVEEYYIQLPFFKELSGSYNKYLAIANDNVDRNMANLEEKVKNSLSKPEEFYFSVSVAYDEISGNYIYFGYDEILKYKDEFLSEKILLFCKEAANSYSLPNIEEVIYTIELGNKKIVFSASDRCLELFEELRKYN